MKEYHDLSPTEKKFMEYIEWYVTHNPKLHMESIIKVLGVAINKYKGVEGK